MTAPRIILAATHSGAGKSSWMLGLLAALRAQGAVVQPFKAGPDYIDPGLHTAACGRVSRNLDTRLMSPACLRRLFARGAVGADLSVIEGVMGYFDGSLDERSGVLAAGSTASLARTLACPALLILDVRGASESAAATALGFLRYTRRSLVRGILLNRVGSPRHAAAVKAAVERRTGLPVLGSLPRRDALALPERHLGLVGASEVPGFSEAVARLGEAVVETTDLGAIRAVAASAPEIDVGAPVLLPGERPADRDLGRVRIAVARDEAFSFLYEDNLDMLRSLGAEPVFFSPLHDASLPRDAGGVYLCGGYPELHIRALAENASMRASVRLAAEHGTPVFAECGGYMYLLDEIESSDGVRASGAGVLPGRALMGKARAMLGYYRAEVAADGILGRKGATLTGHVFHWSSVTGTDGTRPALLLRKPGQPSVPDGMCRGSVFASYLHLHFATCPGAVRRFVAHCRRYSRRFGGICV